MPKDDPYIEGERRMTTETLIKGMLPVCRKCREVNCEEPDKCGSLAWCKFIFTAGADYERDACHAILTEHCDLGADVGIALQHILAREAK